MYRIAGIFRGGGGVGVKFSWMLGFVAIHGKKSVVDGSSLNHTPCACVEQWPLVSEWKLWYEVTTSKTIWDAQVGKLLFPFLK